MNAWMVAYLAVNVLGLGIILAKHGEKREGQHNFFTAVFAWSVSLSLLYMAGAFRVE